MQLVKCGTCGADISKAARACPKCGAPMAQSWGHVAALLVVGAVVIAAAGRWMGVW